MMTLTSKALVFCQSPVSNTDFDEELESQVKSIKNTFARILRVSSQCSSEQSRLQSERIAELWPAEPSAKYRIEPRNFPVA